MLRAEQTRALAPTEAVEWLTRYQAVFDAAHARRGYLRSTTAPAYRRLQEDAAALLPILVDDPAVDSEALRRAQDARRITLRVVAPEPRRGILGRLRDRATRREPPPFRPASADAPRREPPGLGR